MNHMKQIFISLLISSIVCPTLLAQADSSFFEKLASIKNLYKVSPEQLCTILDIPREPVPTITAHELLPIHSSLLLINVLTPNYHDDCHITGSINVPLPELVERCTEWNKAQKIVVYCALEACDAGEKGCILLRQLGFTDVVDYKGGIKEWFQLNYPTEGPAVSSYLHMKEVPAHREYKLYPETIVCSTQIRWINRYRDQ